MRTENMHTRNASTSRWVRTLAALLLASGLTSGCAFLDSIDRKLVAWGVVEATGGATIDTLAVVEVSSGGSKGVGVVLDNGMIFTANHVVKGDRAVVRTFGYHGNAYYRTLEARVVFRDEGEDQAMLSVREVVEWDHTVELGTGRAGPATAVPLRPHGRSSFGDVVNRPVVRTVELGSRGLRYRADRRLRRGDSGAPIVQDGKVVGLVHGASRVIASDVMKKYRFMREAKRRRENAEGVKIVGTPECVVGGAGSPEGRS